jgi:hypothetical protein
MRRFRQAGKDDLKATVKLVAVTERTQRSRKSMPGAGKGKVWMADDFDSPATEELVAELSQDKDGDTFEGLERAN